MAVDTHHIVAFNRTVQQLAGYQFKSLLTPTFRKESERGDVAFFDTIGQDEAGSGTPTTQPPGATETDWANIPSYADYINGNLGALDFANFLTTRTPHNEVEKVRTLCSPKEIEWGYSFRKVDEIAELTDPTSRVMRQGNGKMKTSRDRFCFDALMAANVNRGKDAGSALPVAMPATQILATAASQSFDVDDGARAAELMEKNYIEVAEEDVYGIISPEMKRKMRLANPEIRSRDFVDSYEIFREFKLPKIDSISYICHPRVVDYTRGVNHDLVIFYTMEGMVWNQFDDLESFIERNPDARFEYQAYMREFANAVRVDDKRVIWMDVLP